MDVKQHGFQAVNCDALHFDAVYPSQPMNSIELRPLPSFRPICYSIDIIQPFKPKMNISIPSNHSLIELHAQIHKELLRRNLLSYLKIYNNKSKTSGIKELDEIPPPNIVYDLYAMVLEKDDILTIPVESSILLQEYIKENAEYFPEKQKHHYEIYLVDKECMERIMKDPKYNHALRPKCFSCFSSWKLFG
jgi:hypothetical protein